MRNHPKAQSQGCVYVRRLLSGNTPFWFFYITLFLPPSTMLLAVEIRDAYAIFALTSIVLLLASFMTMHCIILSSTRSTLDRSALLGRLIQLVRRVLAGDPGLSTPTILAFISVTLALYAWFADAIKEGIVLLALGSASYALSVLVALDVLSRVLKQKAKPTRKVFVTPISSPYACRAEDPQSALKVLKEASFEPEELRRMVDEDRYVVNGKVIAQKANFTPILAVIAHPDYSTLEELHLIYASDTIDPKRIQLACLYLGAIKNLAQQLNPRLKGAGKFRRERIGKKGENVSGDIKRFREGILEKYGARLQKHSQDFVFGITTGTAAMSAAIVLVAVKGYAEGVYVRQLRDKSKTSSTLRRVQAINLNIYDFPDLLGEDRFDV